MATSPASSQHLRTGARGVGEKLRRIRARGPLDVALGDHALEHPQRLEAAGAGSPAAGGASGAIVPLRPNRGRSSRSFTRVARGARRIDQGDARHGNRSRSAELAQTLDVARGLALPPQLTAGAAEEVHLAGLAGALDRLGVEVGEHQDLAGAPVLHHAGDKAALVVANRPAPERPSGGVYGRVWRDLATGPSREDEKRGATCERDRRTRGATLPARFASYIAGVGGGEEVVGMELGVGRENDAGAGGESHVAAVDLARPRERRIDAPGDRLDALAVDVLAEDDELVAAEAGDRVRRPQNGVQPAGGLGEEAIARLVRRGGRSPP